jgi:glycerol-3-phosphate dehydrogenase (NAD(P)+)
MRIAVIGFGSWGTTLALVLNENRHEVRAWTNELSTINNIREKSENSRYLPGVTVPDTILVSDDLKFVLDEAEIILNAVPSQVTREVLGQVVPLLTNQNQIWVTVSKGIENNTFKRVSEIIAEVTGVNSDRIVVLSGPSHAEEVSRHVPTAIVAACTSVETAKQIQKVFSTSYFRIYANTDVSGVEIGGALKNIIALAAGICDGAGFGDNTKAALMTRGLVEINRFGAAFNARSDTFAGLSGMGDLIVTCMSKHSRNRHVGEEIGKGRSLKEVLEEMVMVAEGVKTTLSVFQVSKRLNIEMPITEQIYYTLFENKSAHDAMINLMTRESKIEDWS